MPVTRVQSRWVSGNLVFYDESFNTIFTIDGVNDRVTFESGTLNLSAGEIVAADISDDILTGAKAANVSEDATTPGLPVIIIHDVAAVGATAAGANEDITLAETIRVIDAHFVHTSSGQGSDTVQLLSTGAAITDAISASGADTAIARATTIDDAQYRVASGEILRVTYANSATDAAGAAGKFVTLAIRST